MHSYEIGKLYNRKADIHDLYGGSRQSGVSPSAQHPYIFLFTGAVGEAYGYSDGEDENGIFLYTGEGQLGDMKFTNGNKAIRDHVDNGKDLLLFSSLGKGKKYHFMGQFVCAGYSIKKIPDKNTNLRDGIIFHLKSVNEATEEQAYTETTERDFTALRELAYRSVKVEKTTKTAESRISFIERNAAIKSYILARAKGSCECCGKPAPFIKEDNTPYLEVHHIHKLSDKGFDTPLKMAAITPNCHREIHYGKNGAEKDNCLQKIIEEKEKRLAK